MNPRGDRRPRVVVGVGGGIAAYKSCEVIRRLADADVTVVPTEAALKFVGQATFEALSGNPVHSGVFTDVPAVNHVRTGQQADLVVIAPATADLMARAAAGRADDLLTSTLLVTRAPVIFAPAMHTEMWTHPATQANVATLRSRGAIVIPPAVGRLTGPDSGPGRLPEPEHIVELALTVLNRPDALPYDLAGRRVVITAGGTREELDPVRFLGNRSSGRQGFALALVAAARGAEVTLIAANVALPTPPGVRLVPVTDARSLQAAVVAEAATADVVVMAAAVADFRPANRQESKIKKVGDLEPDALALVRNPDILAGLVADRRGAVPLIVGFAAETGDENADVMTYAREKLRRKGCDLLVVNRVDGGRAFEVADNAAVILDSDGGATDVPFGPKTLLAAALWDAVAARGTGGPG
ncbi:bifunctional phosphopantothenoylcysteine decarboxylase/phosphopantothenate--cysteine ligase CoaBC [Nakamurella silvestris]|nr:bifunctional phosphopantothenoylcysteine decarboxylase/phosphopantothenate--cysteine ligase CoaBC [Nakamurella silvestris]